MSDNSMNYTEMSLKFASLRKANESLSYALDAARADISNRDKIIKDFTIKVKELESIIHEKDTNSEFRQNNLRFELLTHRTRTESAELRVVQLQYRLNCLVEEMNKLISHTK